jgi:hypothetical protein
LGARGWAWVWRLAEVMRLPSSQRERSGEEGIIISEVTWG